MAFYTIVRLRVCSSKFRIQVCDYWLPASANLNIQLQILILKVFTSELWV